MEFCVGSVGLRVGQCEFNPPSLVGKHPTPHIWESGISGDLWYSHDVGGQNPHAANDVCIYIYMLQNTFLNLPKRSVRTLAPSQTFSHILQNTP